MKRLIVLLLAAVLSLPAFSQRLTGVWTASEVMDEKQEGVSATGHMTDNLTLSENGSCSQDGSLTMDVGNGEEQVSLTLVFSVKGNWDQEKETLTLRYDPKSLKVEVAESNMPGLMKTMLVSLMKRELKKEMGSRKPEVYTILSLTDGELTLLEQDAGGAEARTYKRK